MQARGQMDFWPRNPDEEMLSNSCQGPFSWDDLEFVDLVAVGESISYKALQGLLEGMNGVLGQAEGEEIWRNRKQIPDGWYPSGYRLLFATIWGDPDTNVRQMFCIDVCTQWTWYFIPLIREEGLCGGYRPIKLLRLKQKEVVDVGGTVSALEES